MKTQITKVSSKYILKTGNKKISATVDLNGKISLYRHNYFNQPFVFKNSKPEDIKIVGKLISEASQIKI